MTPLPYACFSPIPLNQVRPRGWILEFLQRQCAGLTGHPLASGYPFGRPFWGSMQNHSVVQEVGSAWWPYEQTGYWLDGALKAGFLAGDETVYHMALAEIDHALDFVSGDGFIGPANMRTKDRWPYVVFFRAVLAQAAISGDRRYVDALVRHYRSLPHPIICDRDVTGVEILLALYGETGEQDLLETAKDLYARFNALLPEHDCSLATMLSERPVSEHGVTFNEIAKLGAILYEATGEKSTLEATLHAYAKVERDQLLADGMHSCTEGLRGRDPLDSHETCDITDYTWSMCHLLRATGEAHFADQIERVIFNAGPGAITKDFKAVQYFSCPNQVVANSTSNHNLYQRGFNWMAYRPGHHVQCCPGNVHRAMPNYVDHMWQRGNEDEVVAALFGPSLLSTVLAGVPVTIDEDTRYPFEQSVTFTLQPARPARFSFSVRIPGWCQGANILVNGGLLGKTLVPGSFQRIEREWRPGDTIHLALPFSLVLKRWPSGGVSVEYGPLTLSLPVEAPLEVELDDSEATYPLEFRQVDPRPNLPGFPAYKLRPTSPWAYALTLDEESLQRQAQILWNTPVGYPFDLSNPAFTVRVPTRRVKDWTLVTTDRVNQFAVFDEEGKIKSGEREIEGHFTLTPPLPDPVSLPERLSDTVEWIDLVPYGTTLLRLTVFPDGMR